MVIISAVTGIIVIFPEITVIPFRTAVSVITVIAVIAAGICISPHFTI